LPGLDASVILSGDDDERGAMEEFDLDRYLRASKRVDLSGVAWDRVGEHPLSEAEARCLAYMMDIETHTVIFLRDLLATRAASEPDVTAFLACWVSGATTGERIPPRNGRYVSVAMGVAAIAQSIGDRDPESFLLDPQNASA
jgi:hypothetical protein